MIPQRTTTRFAATGFLAMAFVALVAIAVGCGGGDESTTASGPVAAFTADSPTPAAGTIALLPGGSSGTSISVRVTATGLTGFFGAAFRIKYDTEALLFNGMTDSSSFLRPGVTDSDVFFFADATSVPGQVIISATRVDPTVAPPVDLAATSDLVLLNFIARKAISAGAAEGRLDFGDPKQVCDGTVVAPGCGTVAINSWSGGGVSAQ